MSKEELLKKPLKFEIEDIYKVTNIELQCMEKLFKEKSFQE